MWPDLWGRRRQIILLILLGNKSLYLRYQHIPACRNFCIHWYQINGIICLVVHFTTPPEFPQRTGHSSLPSWSHAKQCFGLRSWTGSIKSGSCSLVNFSLGRRSNSNTGHLIKKHKDLIYSGCERWEGALAHRGRSVVLITHRRIHLNNSDVFSSGLLSKYKLCLPPCCFSLLSHILPCVHTPNLFFPKADWFPTLCCSPNSTKPSVRFGAVVMAVKMHTCYHCLSQNVINF